MCLKSVAHAALQNFANNADGSKDIGRYFSAASLESFVDRRNFSGFPFTRDFANVWRVIKKGNQTGCYLLAALLQQAFVVSRSLKRPLLHLPTPQFTTFPYQSQNSW